MTSLPAKLRDMWRRLSWLDVFAAAVTLAGLICALLGFAFGFASFLEFFAVIAAIYLLFRLIGWWRTRLLWSLRNRLIVAYLFIAVVPILLIVTLVILAGQILYAQLGGYLLYEDIQRRAAMMADITDHIAAAHRHLPAGVSEAESEKILASQSHEVHDRELPGMTIDFSNDDTLLRNIVAKSSPVTANRNSFAGLVEQGGKLYLMSLRAMPEGKGVRVVELRLEVNSDFLASVAPDLGAIQLNLTRRFLGGQRTGIVYTSGSDQFETTGRILAKNRVVHPAGYWFDPVVTGLSRLDAVFVAPDGRVDPQRPVLVTFNARPSRLNKRIFASLGEFSGLYAVGVVVVSIFFLLIEIAAFITGLVMTRRITRAVSDLYLATQFVRSQDWTHRVKVERRDQLGMLGESFNEMTGSISGLMDEQKKRQRLENEIAIASEVQNQLFPQKMPCVEGVELEAICKAARTVSGDYYDFIQLSPTHVAIVLADISGKGISAALLMASLQAALRSQLLAPGAESMSTAELVARLNTHLVRNTGDDRFATFFIAVYDCSTRRLRYTNAGHLPGLLISNGTAKHLDKGGMVLGVMEDYPYEEDSVHVPPNALLVQYSDGLIEPENAYGEEFGVRRLQEAAIRVQNAPPRAVGQALMQAAEEWAGTPEQADDMTVIVARMR